VVQRQKSDGDLSELQFPKPKEPSGLRSLTPRDDSSRITSMPQDLSATGYFYDLMKHGAEKMIVDDSHQSEKRVRSASSDKHTLIEADLEFTLVDQDIPVKLHHSAEKRNSAEVSHDTESKNRDPGGYEPKPEGIYQEEGDYIQSQILEKSGREMISVTQKLRSWPFGTSGECVIDCSVEKKPWPAGTPVPILIGVSNRTNRKIKVIQAHFNARNVIHSKDKEQSWQMIMSMEFTKQCIQTSTEGGSFPVKPFSRFSGEITFLLPRVKADSYAYTSYEIKLGFPLTKRLEKTVIYVHVPITFV